MRLKQQLALVSATALGLVLGLTAAQAHAQAAPTSGTAATTDGSYTDSDKDVIVVTGSRIRRAATDTAMPLVMINQQDLTDRGFVSAAAALNNEPSINPQLGQANGGGGGSGSNVQAPALFGLGTGRTLSLLNGRRMVTTTSGLGDSQVDANIIPTGLLSRIEIVKAGGAAVYGSDAIAGVVNYVIRQDFQGLEGDVQTGMTSRGDRPTYSARLTGGTNFGADRGNIAVNVEWSSTEALPFASPDLTKRSRFPPPDGLGTGPTRASSDFPFGRSPAMACTSSPRRQLPHSSRGSLNRTDRLQATIPAMYWESPFPKVVMALPIRASSVRFEAGSTASLPMRSATMTSRAT